MLTRIARGCTSESHSLYGTFMALLSLCIVGSRWFWQPDGCQEGRIGQGRSEQSPRCSCEEGCVQKELAHHCRRKIHNASDTTDLIKALLLAMSPTTDSLGVKLFSWCHAGNLDGAEASCGLSAGSPGVLLYTVTGNITKGGMTLPTYWCARGTMSLESFHFHSARLVIC